jgi:hypothetical protein
MRYWKLLTVVVVCMLTVAAFAGTSQNKFGVADTRYLTFTEPMRVGDILLPKGDYQVQHTMQGMDHIMVFKQLDTRKPAEAHVKCQLVPLQTRAERTEQQFVLNAAKERVLRVLVFQGDTAQHIF